MATAIEESENQLELVERMEPVDTTGFRDPGMRALCTLAVNLGWGVVIKPNNPALIIAPDGTQKRLPTNTSIRMSVFQTSLSTIIAHSDLQPAVSLIDEIVKTTKLSVDHARRMYLAVGESPKQHRERIETEAGKGHREPEPLTTRISIPVPMVIVDDELLDADQVMWEDPPEPTAMPVASVEAVDNTRPADHQDHGTVVSTGPYMAHHHSNSEGVVQTYESDSSFERIWSDGFKDYTCQFCGAAYKSPKGVGSHRQVHVKRGELPKHTEPAFKRTTKRGVETGWTPTTSRSDKGKPRKQVVEPVPDDDVLDLIRALVSPGLAEERDRLREQNEILALEVERLGTENQKLSKDWEALKELIGGG